MEITEKEFLKGAAFHAHKTVISSVGIYDVKHQEAFDLLIQTAVASSVVEGFMTKDEFIGKIETLWNVFEEALFGE